jgi:hypothetical protein
MDHNESLELGVGNMRHSALGAFLAAVEHGGQDLLEARRLKEAPFDVIGNKRVELFHRDSATHTAGLALAGLGRARVVAVPSSLPGPQRHRLAARSAPLMAP